MKDAPIPTQTFEHPPKTFKTLFFAITLVFTGSIKDFNPPSYVMATVHIVLLFAAFAAVSFVVSMFFEMEWRRWLSFVLACLGISAFGAWITIIAEPIAIIGWLLMLCAPMFFIEWLYKRYKARKEEKRLVNIARIARMQYQLDTQPKNEAESYPHSIADILTEDECVEEAIKSGKMSAEERRNLDFDWKSSM